MDLYEARVLARKKQYELAKTVGISQAAISMIENGYLKPNPEQKAAIAGALSLRVQDVDWGDEKCV
jgi:DNA-binding XRE family transcriptional regulator